MTAPPIPQAIIEAKRIGYVLDYIETTENITDPEAVVQRCISLESRIPIVSFGRGDTPLKIHVRHAYFAFTEEPSLVPGRSSEDLRQYWAGCPCQPCTTRLVRAKVIAKRSGLSMDQLVPPAKPAPTGEPESAA